MSYQNRAQIKALQGGDFIVQALDDIQAQVNIQPFRVGGIYVRTGKGTPSSVVNGSVGDIYLRSDGGTGTTLYVKESGTNTSSGWVSK